MCLLSDNLVCIFNVWEEDQCICISFENVIEIWDEFVMRLFICKNHDLTSHNSQNDQKKYYGSSKNKESSLNLYKLKKISHRKIIISNTPKA